MAETFELRDRETANQIGADESRSEASAIVRNAVREAGVNILATVALDCEDEEGHTIVIAAGPDLADLAAHEGPLVAPHAADS